MLPTLVVPLDGAEFSTRALPAALSIARAGKSDVRLVGIARTEDAVPDLRGHAQDSARLAGFESSDVAIVVNDDPTEALLEISDDPGTVLCFASHDHTPLATALSDSVGSRLIEAATHPYIVVGAAPTDGGPALVGTDVVVAVDGVDDPEPLLATAAAWALALQAALRLVTVYEPVSADIRHPDHFTRHHGPPGDADAYAAALGRRLEAIVHAPVEVAAVADATSAADGLTRYLHDRPALLVVLGGGRRDGLSLGPGVLHRLLREMPLPVLVVNRP
jgi:Universal stress protein family